MPCMLGLGDSIAGVDLGISPRLFCLSHKRRKQGSSLMLPRQEFRSLAHVGITLTGSLIISYIVYIRAQDVP